MRVRAWPRRQKRSGGERVYDFEFDAEHGTVLRWVACEGGRLFRVTEALNISYEPKIDPSMFELGPPESYGRSTD